MDTGIDIRHKEMVRCTAETLRVRDMKVVPQDTKGNETSRKKARGDTWMWVDERSRGTVK